MICIIFLNMGLIKSKKKKYQQNICFGGFENFKERCYLKGIHYSLALKILKNLIPNIKIELNYMSKQDYITRKGRINYPQIMEDKSFIEVLIKKELESLSKVLRKHAPNNHHQNTTPRILQQQKVSIRLY